MLILMSQKICLVIQPLIIVICSFHPSLALLTTTSGQRQFNDSLSVDSDSEDEGPSVENSIKLWWIGA